MSETINQTLQDFMNNSSTVCVPQGYDKQFPSQSVNQPGFTPNNYYKLFKSFANSNNTFEDFRALAALILNRPYNPLYADALLLDALKNVLGIQFINDDMEEDTLRRVLYAKLLANINDGTIANTIQVFQTLLDPLFVQRIRLGEGTPDVSYCAIGGTNPLTIDELEVFWDEAKTGGVFIELRHGPIDFFGFYEDPLAMGFSSISEALVVRAPPPYFGFFEDPESTGFSTLDAPTSGGQFPVLTTATEGGGHFVKLIYGQYGVN